MQEEYLDLVDQNDIVIGKEKRSEIYRLGFSNYRVVNAFIKNSKGELWIPRRTAHKKMYPLFLDMSMGGHVEAGETYEETFIRETKEELNVDVTKFPHKMVGYFKAGEQGLSSFMKVYEIILDEAPVYNHEDFIEYYWLSPKNLLGKIKKGELCKSDLPILVNRLYCCS